MFKVAYKLLSEFEGQVGKMKNAKQNLSPNQLILELELLILSGPQASDCLPLSLLSIHHLSIYHLSYSLSLPHVIPPSCTLSPCIAFTFPLSTFRFLFFEF